VGVLRRNRRDASTLHEGQVEDVAWRQEVQRVDQDLHRKLCHQHTAAPRRALLGIVAHRVARASGRQQVAAALLFFLVSTATAVRFAPRWQE
jgi:hypothetical protein